MKNLTSMLEYLLLQQTFLNTQANYDTYAYVTFLDRYAQFLCLKLELWMLIPCDEDGTPMIKPTSDHSDEYVLRYQKAVDRLYFQHVTLDQENEMISGDFFLPLEEIENMTINELNNLGNYVGLTERIQKYLTEL